MNPESRQLSDMSNRERLRDLEWIGENRNLFWLNATVAFEQTGRGVLMVDLISEPQEQGHPFSYYEEGELELRDKDLRRFLYDYAPDREFVVVLLKPGGRVGVYRERPPPFGWETDLRTRTRYKQSNPSHEKRSLQNHSSPPSMMR